MSLLQNILPSFACVAAPGAPAPAAKPTAPVKPNYEIKENPDTYDVTVCLPGVTKDSLEITADEQQVRLVGRRVWRRPETWSPVYLESGDAVYELVLSHDHAIDTKKIRAELRDGVLRVTLPKPEAAKPLKIAVA
jgi:HSP20 family protein